MDISRIDISLDSVCCITLIARPGKIDFDIAGTGTLSSIPIYTKGYTSQVESILHSIGCLLQLYRPDTITTEYSTKEFPDVFTNEFTLDELFDTFNNDKEYREKYFNTDSDGMDCDVSALYSHYCHEIIKPGVIQLASTTVLLTKLDEIKNQECPVLLEPLDATAIKFLKCSHFISGKAYQTLKNKSSLVICPLCRAEHHSGEVV